MNKEPLLAKKDGPRRTARRDCGLLDVLRRASLEQRRESLSDSECEEIIADALCSMKRAGTKCALLPSRVVLSLARFEDIVEGYVVPTGEALEVIFFFDGPIRMALRYKKEPMNFDREQREYVAFGILFVLACISFFFM